VEFLSFNVHEGRIGISDDHKSAVDSIDGKTMDPASLGGFLAYFDNWLIDHDLIKLLRSDGEWDDNKEMALNLVKQKLTQAPMRALVNYRSKLYLYCDASDTGFSGVLLQSFKHKLFK